MSVIAAMLMMTAIGLIDTKHFRYMFDESRKDFYISILTVFLVLLFDAGIAVLVGTVIALMYLLEKTTDGTSEISFYKNHDLVKRIVKNRVTENDISNSTNNLDYDTVVYSIGGFLSYIDSEHHIDNISEIAKDTKVTKIGIRMRNLDYADFEAMEELGETIRKIQDKNIKVFISSVHEQVLTDLLELHIFKQLNDNKLIFRNTHEALL